MINYSELSANILDKSLNVLRLNNDKTKHTLAFIAFYKTNVGDVLKKDNQYGIYGMTTAQHETFFRSVIPKNPQISFLMADRFRISSQMIDHDLLTYNLVYMTLVMSSYIDHFRHEATKIEEHEEAYVQEYATYIDKNILSDKELDKKVKAFKQYLKT